MVRFRANKGANFRTVWRTLQEMGKKQEEERKQREKERKQREAERKQREAELAEMRKKNEAELTEQRRRNEAELAEMRRKNEAELTEMRKKNEAELTEMRRETEAERRKAEKAKKELEKQLGALTNRFGELAEHLIAPGIVRRFNELGYHFDDITAQNVVIRDEQGKDLTEIDLLCENNKYSIAVEVKSYPVLKDVQHQTKRLEIFREHKDRRGDKRIIRGAIAGAVFPPDVQKAAIDAGFYVIVQSGDTMKILLPTNFTPKDF